MAKLNDKEREALSEIARWKAGKPSFLNRATDVVSKPINWLTETMIPPSIREKGADVTEKIAEKLQDLSQLTIDRDEVLRATREYEIDSRTVLELKNVSIFNLDNVARNFIENNTRVAALTGAGTGLAGWPGLIADLPALFMLSLRTIHQIALCYGYDIDADEAADGHKEFEMGYMMRIFKVATAADPVQKQLALAEIKDFEAGRQLELSEGVGGDYTTRQVGKSATSFVSRHLIREIIEQTLKKKAMALVPALGALFSAGFNYVYLKDVGEAAYMLYRERFLIDKQGRTRVINIEIE